MHFIDHIFILLLFVLQPVCGAFDARYYIARSRAGLPAERVRFYRQTALIEWVFLLVLIAVWLDFDRPVADLGLVTPGGAGFWAGTALCVGLVGFLLYYWRSAQTASAAQKTEYTNSLGDLVVFLPHTRTELRSFCGVSITAGIVEELVYRGFVIWYLAQYMPIWVAVGVSSAAFGIAHSYLGRSGMLRAGLAGLAFGVLYVVTGSIWLPIIAHALIDLLQGAALHEVLREDHDQPEPQLA